MKSLDLRAALVSLLLFAVPLVGMFLLVLFLNFIFEERDITWLSWIERPLARISKIKRRAGDFDPEEGKTYTARPVIELQVCMGKALRTIDKNGIDAVLADLRARGEKI